MKKLCIVTTMWSSISNWILPFLNEYNRRGVDVTIVCNMDDAFQQRLKQQYPFVHTHSIAFPRGIRVGGSVKSMVELYRFFKQEKFDMVQYSTPNASMYAAVVAKLAGIPVRLYCQWGMVFVTMSGVKRRIFETIERLVCRLSTQVQPDSQGNLDFCRQNGLYNEAKSCLIWNGSAKGLNLDVFDIQKRTEYASRIKKQYNIPADAPVVGFVGRLGREKGCHELFQSFRRLKQEFPKVKLLFVGPIEKEETITPELLQYFWQCDDIIKTDRVSHVEWYVAAMDVFVLPSYREGFGMSVIEASAMGVPVVVTRYPGPSSAMEEGLTGYAVPVGDVDQLTDHVRQLLLKPDMAKQLGENGRRYVEERFEQKVFIKQYMKNRMALLGESQKQ